VHGVVVARVVPGGGEEAVGLGQVGIALRHELEGALVAVLVEAHEEREEARVVGAEPAAEVLRPRLEVLLRVEVVAERLEHRRW